MPSRRRHRHKPSDTKAPMAPSPGGRHPLPAPGPAETADLAAANERLQREVTALSTKLREAGRDRRKAMRAARESKASDEGTALFIDPVEQFRFDVYVAWAERIPAEQKAALPLGDYVVGDRFLASLSEVHGVERAKVLQVVVEVLTGLDRELDSRERHVLRGGAAGSTAPVTRDDGAVCWRVSIQRRRPGALRLHFWAGSRAVELSRVVPHDDMNP